MMAIIGVYIFGGFILVPPIIKVDVSMKEYLMVQRVKAKPMTRKEYNDLRGWLVPENENPDDEGFLIESEGKPNHPDYEGYLQWLTKEQFEKSILYEVIP